MTQVVESNNINASYMVKYNKIRSKHALFSDFKEAALSHKEDKFYQGKTL